MEAAAESRHSKTVLTPAQHDAVGTIARAAVVCEQLTQCPAEMSAAQCIFESAYLTKSPGNNCFGIKCDQHGSGTQYVLTHEFVDGSYKLMPQTFETYLSLTACFADHARLIQTGVYALAWAQYLIDRDIDRYITGVAVHYASDQQYAGKIIQEAHSATVQEALQQIRGEAGLTHV